MALGVASGIALSSDPERWALPLRTDKVAVCILVGSLGMTPIHPVDSVGARFEELHRKAPTNIFNGGQP